MRALVTGFEPFEGDRINPSFEVLAHLPPTLGELDVQTQVLPCVFGQALTALRQAVAAARPDIVLCVGLAGGRAELSLERVAINVDDARIADNAGNRPVDVPIVAGGPPAYFTGLPVKAAVAELRRAGLPAGVSNSAGTLSATMSSTASCTSPPRPGSAAGSCTSPICRSRPRGTPARRRWRSPIWCAGSRSS
jgi:pyroglutamyl-peptidase